MRVISHLSSLLLKHLSRITSGRRIIPQIDGLRFVALMAVLVYHLDYLVIRLWPRGEVEAMHAPLHAVFRMGNYGVNLFFAISGFVLALPFARYYLTGGKPVSLQEYYLRRLTRLEPPYIIQLIVVFAVAAVVLGKSPTDPLLYHNEHWIKVLAQRFSASLFYVHTWIFRAHPYPNIVLWSLEVEVQFYMLAPFLTRIFAVRSAAIRRSILIAVILGFSWIASYAGEHYLVSFTLLGLVQYFLIGFLLVDLYLTDGLERENGNFAWDLAMVAGAALIVWINGNGWRLMTFPWIFLCMGAAAFRGKITSAALSNRWVMTCGGMCYTIYMYHLFMMILLVKITTPWRVHVFWLDLLLQGVLVICPVLVGSAVLFMLFERPFMQRDWPGKFKARVQAWLA